MGLGCCSDGGGRDPAGRNAANVVSDIGATRRVVSCRAELVATVTKGGAVNTARGGDGLKCVEVRYSCCHRS